MREALFVLSNLFAVAASFLIADRVMKGRELWRRNLAAVAGFPVVVLVIVLGLGTAGLLTAGWAAIAAGVVAGAVWLVVRFRPEPPLPADSPTDPGHLGFLATPMAVALLGGFGGAWIVLLGVAGTRFGPDDYSYHAPAVAHWMVDRAITLAPLNYHAYFPFNAETLSLWFMLPFGADGAASLSGLFWAGLLVAAAFGLAIALGNGRRSGMLTGALLLASPVLFESASTVAAVDLAGPAMVLAAVALAIPPPPPAGHGPRLADAVYSGLLSGFAAGCKISLLPVAGVLFLRQALGRRGKGFSKQEIGGLLAFGLGAAVTGWYWYTRNWAVTGNPFFPAALGPFEGPFGPAEQAQTKLVRWATGSPIDRSVWAALVRAHLAWPVGLFLVAAVGYGSAMLRLITRRGFRAAEDPASLLLAVGMLLGMMYPFLPFTGTFNEPDGGLAVSLRYLIAPFAIGVVLFGSLIDDEHPRRAAGLAITILAAVGFHQLGNGMATLVVGFGLMASVTWFLAKRAWVLPKSAAVALAGLLLLVLAMTQARKQRLTDQRLFAMGEPDRPIGRAWQALDRLPAGSRVASFGPLAYRYYPTLGRRFQLTPVALNPDGSGFRPLHELFAERRTPWWSDDDHVDLSSLVPSLFEARVSHVFVSKWNLDQWPMQQEVIARSGRAHTVYDDGYSVIWELEGPQ